MTRPGRLVGIAMVVAFVGASGLARGTGGARPAGKAAPARKSAPAAPAHGGLTAGMDCSACHTSAGWTMASGAGAGQGFDHATTGFPLRDRHAQVACAACHTGAARVSPDCARCHTDSHQGRLGPACADCHEARDFRDVSVKERHRRTRLPLTGRHALVACSACHQRQSERAWSDAPADCFACHEQDYRRDIHPDHDGDAADPTQAQLSRQCGACHRPTGWTPATLDPGVLRRRLAPVAPAGHDARFVLTSGKHRGAACATCHVGPTRDRRVSCTGCHAHDPARLRAQHGRGAVGTSAATCLQCHPGGVGR